MGEAHELEDHMYGSWEFGPRSWRNASRFSQLGAPVDGNGHVDVLTGRYLRHLPAPVLARASCLSPEAVLRLRRCRGGRGPATHCAHESESARGVRSEPDVLGVCLCANKRTFALRCARPSAQHNGRRCPLPTSNGVRPPCCSSARRRRGVCAALDLRQRA
jgi:hypothetical protein